MGFSETNRAFIQIARETTPKVLPGSPRVVALGWNSIEGWSPTIEMTASDEVSPTNQVEPGQPVDKMANGSIQMDLNLSRVLELVEMALHANLTGAAVALPSAASGTAFTVPAMLSAPPAGTLVKVRGCAIAANNGIKEVDAGATTINIPIVGGLSIEAGLTARGVTMEVCGFRFATDDATMTVSGGVTTFGATAKNLTQLGLVAGSPVLVCAADGTATNANRFAQAANRGPARVAVTPTATAIVLENTTQTFVTDPGTSKRIDLYFGREARIRYLTDANYAEPTLTVEITNHKLGAGDVPAYSVSQGMRLQSLQLAMPEKAKATMSASFVGEDCLAPSTVRGTGFSTPLPLHQNMLVNTTSNIARGRLRKLNGNGLRTSYITAVNFTIESVTERNGAHGVMGAVAITQGKVKVKAEINAHHTIPEIITDLVAGELLGGDWFIANNDGGLIFDMPQCQAAGGAPEYPMNQTVRISLEAGASRDPIFGTSLIIGHFPHVPLV